MTSNEHFDDSNFNARKYVEEDHLQPDYQRRMDAGIRLPHRGGAVHGPFLIPFPVEWSRDQPWPLSSYTPINHRAVWEWLQDVLRDGDMVNGLMPHRFRGGHNDHFSFSKASHGGDIFGVIQNGTTHFVYRAGIIESFTIPAHYPLVSPPLTRTTVTDAYAGDMLYTIPNSPQPYFLDIVRRDGSRALWYSQSKQDQFDDPHYVEFLQKAMPEQPHTAAILLSRAVNRLVHHLHVRAFRQGDEDVRRAGVEQSLFPDDGRSYGSQTLMTAGKLISRIYRTRDRFPEIDREEYFLFVDDIIKFQEELRINRREEAERGTGRLEHFALPEHALRVRTFVENYKSLYQIK